MTSENDRRGPAAWDVIVKRNMIATHYSCINMTLLQKEMLIFSIFW